MSRTRSWRTLVQKNTRTEVMAPRSTRRVRTRSDALRAAISQFEDDVDDAMDVMDEDEFYGPLAEETHDEPE